MKLCVIGLGRLGHQVAITLAENKADVLAIDRNEMAVAAVKDHVSQAICVNIIDEDSLRSIGAHEIDTAVVAIGDDLEQSVLITALLKKKLNLKRVITRATNELHRDILELIGADHVILPEKEFGIKLANKLSSTLIHSIKIADNFSIIQLKTPSRFVGHTIGDLKLYRSHNIYCIGIKQSTKIIYPVDPAHKVQENDILLLEGPDKDLEIVAKL